MDWRGRYGLENQTGWHTRLPIPPVSWTLHSPTRCPSDSCRRADPVERRNLRPRAAGDLNGMPPSGCATTTGTRVPQGRYPVEMDPDNLIVTLCLEGMGCESRGRAADALGFFTSAWMQSKDDFERCIAAHYVARHQEEPVEALLWNQRSLDHAKAVADDRVREFYPSLYLNLGRAQEDLGNHEDSRRLYQEAERLLDSLPEGRYANIVREAVERALVRVRE